MSQLGFLRSLGVGRRNVETFQMSESSLGRAVALEHDLVGPFGRSLPLRRVADRPGHHRRSVELPFEEGGPVRQVVHFHDRKSGSLRARWSKVPQARRCSGARCAQNGPS